jgi:hypothetical protein
MKEDPTRDPASEARDDHASEPRATPETDAMETIWTDTGLMVVSATFARRLERQRDELLEALEFYRKHMLLGYDITDSGQVAEAALAAVKGGDQ